MPSPTRRAAAPGVKPVAPAVPPVARPPFPNVGIRAMPTQAEARKAHLPPNEAGAGKPRETIPRAFLLRMRGAGAVGPTVPGYERPDWVAKLTKAKSPPEALLAALRERVQRAPSDAGLREAAMLLNDVGRLPDGGRLMRTHLTQQAVDAVLRWKEG